MSSQTPLFTTAPRLVIKVGGTKLAFAVGMSINVSVDLQPVQIIGEFGPVAIEPVRYNVVTGTMQIIRLATTSELLQYNSYFTDNPGVLGPSAYVETTENGNITKSNLTAVSSLDSNNPLAQNGLIRHMDPRTVLLSVLFDLELHMKVPNSASGDVAKLLNTDFKDDPVSLNANDPQNPLYVTVPWMKISGCRITSRNVNISSGALVNEPVSFQGLLASSYGLNSAGATTELMKADDGGNVGF